ncbi:MAG TPA: TetR/AcrR family transcriptional regulator [Phototrophicaceae bacterium]|jgi:AcrR family transcriptional regulator|nr:TetR/AcrR family transcriptional regulator [Phototrophicaceae bacterium]
MTESASTPSTRPAVPVRDQRRHDLTTAAYALIAERGFEGLRVRDVAAQAGVNIATLHYYFPTKENLIGGVVDHLIHQFLTLEAPAVEGEPDTPFTQLHHVILDLQYQLQVAPEMFAVLTELHLRSQRDEHIRTLLADMNQRWQNHLESICQTGIETGIFRTDLDAPRTASLMIALVKGISLQALSGLDQFDFDAIWHDIARMVLQHPF